MTAGKVLEVLGITRRTLTNYVLCKKINVIKKTNGFYEYDDLDVLNLAKNRVFKDKIIIHLNNTLTIYNLSLDLIKDVQKYIVEIS